MTRSRLLRARLGHGPTIRVILLASLAASGAACSDPATGAPRQQLPPSLTILSGNGQTGEVGGELPALLVVELRDSVGRPVPGVFIRFANYQISHADSTRTDADGRVSLRWTLGPVAGTQTIHVETIIFGGANASPVTFTALAQAGAVAHIRITLEQTLAPPGARLDTVVAVVSDRFNNPVASAPLTWAVEGGDGTVVALSVETDAQGIARALWTLGSAAGPNSLLATVGDVIARASAIASDGFPATTVVAGSSHTCALTPAGEAYCWGANDHGQLGAGYINSTPRSTPVRVAGTLSFKSLSASGPRTCGLTTIGSIFCWRLTTARAHPRFRFALET